MEDDTFLEFNAFKSNKGIKTYYNAKKKSQNPSQAPENSKVTVKVQVYRNPLTTKDAAKYLIEGTLRNKVCRYCLNESMILSDLDQILQISGKTSLNKVTIKDIVASFHPFEVVEDPNFPNKICEKCLDKALSAYLFTQQCEQSERALRNYFEDVYEKVEKLDPLQRTSKRGRQKLNPNYNKIFVENKLVIDYAEPIINLVNTNSVAWTRGEKLHNFECLKCCEILPNVESLLIHEKTHPKSMWYHCRLCGKAFSKRYQLKRHIKSHNINKVVKITDNSLQCKCGYSTEERNEYLQHLEKHKLKVIMEHVVERKMDRLCCVCLDKKEHMSELDKMMRLHGGIPGLTGDISLYSILGSTLPDMNLKHNYMGNKICEKCLNHAIVAYVFINQFYFSRNRLNTCLNLILGGLKEIKSLNKNIFIEISDKAIMPIQETDDNVLLDDHEFVDEKKLKVDVLEDEFRMKSEESNAEKDSTDNEGDGSLKTSRKYVNRNKKLVNGYQKLNPVNDVSEFLTFKTPMTVSKKRKKRPLEKYTCPLCSKHFVSGYFLKRHILKHTNTKVECGVCGEVFKSKFLLYEHNKMEHILQKRDYNTCNICDRNFDSTTLVMLHLKKHFSNSCQLCDKLFVSQQFYNNHMQRHAAKLRKIKQKHSKVCSFCEKECVNDNELSLHVNKIHLQIKPYACDMCDHQFYTERNLSNHKKVHTCYAKETCILCDKTFKSRKQLAVHVKKHMDVAKYNCQLSKQNIIYSPRKALNHAHMKWREPCS